jgi:hypothetical protein
MNVDAEGLLEVQSRVHIGRGALASALLAGALGPLKRKRGRHAAEQSGRRQFAPECRCSHQPGRLACCKSRIKDEFIKQQSDEQQRSKQARTQRLPRQRWAQCPRDPSSGRHRPCAAATQKRMARQQRDSGELAADAHCRGFAVRAIRVRSRLTTGNTRMPPLALSRHRKAALSRVATAQLRSVRVPRLSQSQRVATAAAAAPCAALGVAEKVAGIQCRVLAVGVLATGPAVALFGEVNGFASL